MFSVAPRIPQLTLSPRYIQVRKKAGVPAQTAEVVIGICVRNQARHLRAALESAMSQDVMQTGKGIVLILDDASDDDWQTGVHTWLNDPRLVIVNALCGTAARARNALLDWVDAELPNVKWVARLDADDRLVDVTVISSLMQRGKQAGSAYVLGSNHLSIDGKCLPNSNIAQPAVLQNRHQLLAFIEAFCLHGQHQELPSCNLLLRTRTGIRYPDVQSAEDHWLVSELLMLQPEIGVVVPEPIYAIYSLGGSVTKQNRRSTEYSRQRQKLGVAARYWLEALNKHGKLLGAGQEGVVWCTDDVIHKHFYPWALDDKSRMAIESLTARGDGPVPPTKWSLQANGSWQCTYPWFASTALPQFLSHEMVSNYLKLLYQCGYVTSNIKRSNLRINQSGQLAYIDIGKDIVAFKPSRLLDAAARLYSIGILGQSDHELARRETTQCQHEALACLPGFDSFYRNLVEGLFPHCQLSTHTQSPNPIRHEQDVTLLIKVCGQDYDTLQDQVGHIVSQLAYPVSFAKTVLLIDPHQGPFLRQYAPGDLPQVMEIAKQLQAQGLVDEIWLAPTTDSDITNTHLRWFNRSDITASHTAKGAPLFAQLWAFDRLTTPYVLQCDVDVLIGRRDMTHDYLTEMLAALKSEGVVSVGFNIPQSDQGFKDYEGEPGQFAPEIRCGLLHLPRLRTLRPLPNTVKQDKFELMWHRSVQRQTNTNYRSLRGGDSRSYYLHPLNTDKSSPHLQHWRDLVAQGHEPESQRNHWDIIPTAAWSYPSRSESLVFLLKGRGTSYECLKRCIESLALQQNQQFGLIIIDDGSPYTSTWHIPMILGKMLQRTTLIRQREHQGRIRNFITAIQQICINPDTLIVTLDLDDSLLSPQVSTRLLQVIAEGADLVNGGMFRPDKPLHLYPADYENARARGGGNVWAHLRGFRKRLFESLPKHYLQHDGKWVDSATDYAIMLPLSEIAKNPTYIDDMFCYYHQRAPYSSAYKERQQTLLNNLFNKAPAYDQDAAAPT